MTDGAEGERISPGTDGDRGGTSSEADTDSDGSGAAPPSASRRGRPKKPPLPAWQETILLVGMALILALIIKTFFLQAFYIPSGSMENT